LLNGIPYTDARAGTNAADSQFISFSPGFSPVFISRLYRSQPFQRFIFRLDGKTVKTVHNPRYQLTTGLKPGENERSPVRMREAR
jgi:hypothetical protein